MSKGRAIPRIEDGVTDRAAKALSDSVREMRKDIDAIPRTPYSTAQSVNLHTLRAATNVSMDGRISNSYRLVLDQNVTIANPTGVTPGQSIRVSLVQDSTGSRTATWGSAWKFEGASKTLTTAAGSVDMYSGSVETVSPSGEATLIIGTLIKGIA